MPLAIPSNSTELRPTSSHQSDTHILIHSKPPTPDTRPSRRPRTSPAQESTKQKQNIKKIDDLDDPSSSSNNHPASSSHEDPFNTFSPDDPVLPIEQLPPEAIIPHEHLDRIIHDDADIENDSDDTVDYGDDVDDNLLVFDSETTNKTSLCYMNTSSFTVPFVELFDALAAKAVKKGNHAEVTANQLKQHAKEFRLAKAKEFRSRLDNKTIIFVDSRTMQLEKSDFRSLGTDLQERSGWKYSKLQSPLGS